MTRHVLACAAIISALAAGGALAQDAGESLDTAGEADALTYIQGLLADDPYDPRDRQRALNWVDPVDTFWRRSIFDGRRTRATHGTGLQLPDFFADKPE